MTLILALCAVPAIGQTPPGAESPTSWTFDTYAPGPCSPTGAGHGGCNPGRAGAIAVTTIASGLVQPWHLTFLPGTSDVLVTELPGRLRIIRNGVLDPVPVPGWPIPVDSFAHAPFIRPASALRRQPHRVPDLRKGKGRGDAYADDMAVARARFDGKALSAVERFRGRRMGRRLVAGTRGVRARRQGVPLGGRARQPEQQRRCQ